MITHYRENEKKSQQLNRSDWGTYAPISDNTTLRGEDFNSTSPNRQSRTKKRPTPCQARASLDTFRPFPKLTPQVAQTKLLQNRGGLLAFLDVDLYLDGTRIFMMRGVRIVRNHDGSIYCQLPHQQTQKDKRYYPIIRCYDKELKRDIQQAALDAYNDAIGSLERQVLPGARKFEELGIQSKKQLGEPRSLEDTPRSAEHLIVKDE